MNLKIKNLSLNEISKDILEKLEKLFSKAYFNSYMYVSFLDDLKEKHNYFQIFLAYENEKIIWIAVLEDKIHKWVNYWNYPSVHLQRFTVDPNYRGSWIWKKLLDKIKDYAFNNYWLSVIFWESNEIWWINFYLKEWALFNKKIIETYLKRNSKSENLYFFKEFVNNKKFRTFRYSEWSWLLFIYVKDNNLENKFKDNWFYDKKYFLDI